ncbi:MAG: hypothetical protein IH604_15670 [Burkholderiales bacterium]|nr:hypothetical protein [Burkholderiales bacterium]
MKSQATFVARDKSPARSALALRALPQHRQQTQANQMRDSLLFRARLFVSQLTAEYARRLDLGRKSGFGCRVPERDRRVAKQIARFTGNALAIRHTAPRILVSDRLTSTLTDSFHAAVESVLRYLKYSKHFFRSLALVLKNRMQTRSSQPRLV